MDCLKPIDESLEFTLRSEIKALLKEIRELKEQSRGELKHSLYSFKRSEINTAKKKETDLMALYDNTTGDLIGMVYTLMGKIIQLGDTIDIDCVRTREDAAYCKGHAECFSQIYRNWRSFGQIVNIKKEIKEWVLVERSSSNKFTVWEARRKIRELQERNKL